MLVCLRLPRSANALLVSWVCEWLQQWMHATSAAALLFSCTGILRPQAYQVAVRTLLWTAEYTCFLGGNALCTSTCTGEQGECRQSLAQAHHL